MKKILKVENKIEKLKKKTRYSYRLWVMFYDYGASVGTETNSIIDQKNKRKKNKEKNVMATLNVR